MSVQTPIFVSNNYNALLQDYHSCSVVDANGNIYTSLHYSNITNYGAIQKTNTSGITSLFLQLDSTNTPGYGEQFPTGMCFDSSGNLYYVIFGNNNIYKITNFSSPIAVLVSSSSTISAPFRIIMNNQNSNIFYISSQNDAGGTYSITSYNVSTNTYSLVFNLNASGYPESNYGLAQDPITGSNLYIGLNGGKILKGALSGSSVSLWLTLPQPNIVTSLAFTANYTLIANTDNGYGYIININPTTNNGTYNLYYDTTNASIVGGLGLNVFSTFLYGISTTQLWKVKRYPLQTEYVFLYGGIPRDFVEIFDTSNPGTIITNYKSAAYGGLDLGQIFTVGSSLVTTSYTSHLLSGNDLGSYFALINAGTKVWSALGSGCNDFVQSIAIYNNKVYAGGIFITAGGVTVNNIAMWNGSSWSALGGGCNSGVNTVTIDPITGNVYAGGNFTTAGGVPANYIAMWNGSSWSALGTGCGAAVETIAVVNSTNVYAGGIFTTAGGVPANYIAKWNGSSWSALGSGFNLYVYNIALDSANNVYAGGSFTTAGGVTVNRIAKWNGSSWSALGSGCSADVYNIKIDTANNVYVCGIFITAGGVTVNRIAKWNGTSWSALGSGFNSSAWDIAIDSANNVYVAGYYTTAGGISANYIAKWDGTAWSTLIDVTTGVNGCNGVLSAVAIDNVGNVYAGGGFSQAGGKNANNIAIYGAFTTTGTVTKTSDGTYNTILTWTTSGSITFKIPFTVNYTIIGGGAAGQNGFDPVVSPATCGSGGNGGGNGQSINSAWTSTTTTYTITVGSGGNPGVGSGASGSPGSFSSISGTNISVSASGGVVNAGGTGGSGGSSTGPGGIGGNSLVGGGGGAGGSGGNNSSKAGGSGGNGGGAGGAGGGGGNVSADCKGFPGAPGQNKLGGGGGGGGGSGLSGFNEIGGAGGAGGSGTVVLKFIVQ